MIFKKGELFCGPGGIGFGAFIANKSTSEYGVQVLHTWANDIDLSSCNTYSKNLCASGKRNIVFDESSIDEENTILCKDIRYVDFSVMPEIDALTFGFPCNDFSLIGKQKGFDGKYGPLYSYGIKAINQFSPLWFIAENVSGLKSANDGYALKKILGDLKHAGSEKFGGYNLTAHQYNFADYGVPQARHRIIIVGIRKDMGLKFNVPAPLFPDKTAHLSSKWAFEHSCYGEGSVENVVLNNEKTKHPNSIVERLRNIPPGENAWFSGLDDKHKLSVKGAKLSNIYKRLDPNLPSYTVTGSGGGGTQMYHFDEPRALTNRERARLQTFPDSFEFYGNRTEVRRQIGMAVPPKAVEAIMIGIAKTFAYLPYQSIGENIIVD